MDVGFSVAVLGAFGSIREGESPLTSMGERLPCVCDREASIRRL